MFGFLKDKFKKAFSKFSSDVEKEIGAEEAKQPEEAVSPEEPEVSPEKRAVKKDSGKKKAEPSVASEEKAVEDDAGLAEQAKDEKKHGVFSRISDAISKKNLSEKQFEDLFFGIEIELMQNNVAVEVIEKIKNDLKNELVDKSIMRKRVSEVVSNTLKRSISEILDSSRFSMIDVIKERVKEKRPFVVSFVGINGSGKTTTIAKVCHLLKKKGLSCVLAAGDTFRAASIEQLQLHADNLGVRLIKHSYGSDAAAVAFDAVKYAESKRADVVLIDTAGRLHSNVNLMDEVKKLSRVVKPDMTIFVGESITGNDCVEQAQRFNEALGIDGIILTKSDVDEKGGAAISISYVTKKPVLYLGTGQEYDDLAEFDAEKLVSEISL